MKNISSKNILIAILVIATVLPAIASAASTPNILVSGFEVKGEASVGGDFILALNLTNVGPSCVIGITSTVQADFPFIMRGVSTVAAEDLCEDKTEEVDIPLRIDPTASGGSYQIKITNTFHDLLYNEYSSTQTLNVLVEGAPQMSAHVTQTSPVDVYAGDTATMTIAIENLGSFQAQAVNATLTSDSPLIVKWSDSYDYLGTIGARQSKPATFTIEVPKDINDVALPIHLDVSYLDENLEQRTKTFYMVFYAKGKAIFEADDVGGDSLSPNENSRIIKFMLNNTGTDTAKNIKVKLQPQYPFTTDGSVRYVSELAPGQSAPVQFMVDIDKDGTLGEYGLNLIVSYDDSQGRQMQDTADIAVNVTRKSFFTAVFADYWFVWLVVVIAAVIILRRRMAKNPSGKAAKKKK